MVAGAALAVPGKDYKADNPTQTGLPNQLMSLDGAPVRKKERPVQTARKLLAGTEGYVEKWTDTRRWLPVVLLLAVVAVDWSSETLMAVRIYDSARVLQPQPLPWQDCVVDLDGDNLPQTLGDHLDDLQEAQR
jgi:hypothetical protein